MKKDPDSPKKDLFLKFFGFSKPRKETLTAFLGAFVLPAFVVCSGIGGRSLMESRLHDFEAGRVAPRDIIAEKTMYYTDEEATKLKIEDAGRGVPAVFRYSREDTALILSSYKRFMDISADIFLKGDASGGYQEAVQRGFPGAFTPEILDALFRDPLREKLLEDGGAVLARILERGIFALPRTGLELYNAAEAEVLYENNGDVIREQVRYDDIATAATITEQLAALIAGGSYTSAFVSVAPELIKPFIAENVFFSAGDTAEKINALRSQVEPVTAVIEKGEHIVREGFIISARDMVKLNVLDTVMTKNNLGRSIGYFIALAVAAALCVFFLCPGNFGRPLNVSELYLLAILCAAYVTGAVFTAAAAVRFPYYPASLFFPTALTVMLPAILIGARAALSLTVLLPLAALVTGSFDGQAFVFALVSGFSAVFTIQGVERRMDLFKAGFFVAAANTVVMAALLLTGQAPLLEFPGILLWAAANGLVQGMLVMGFLPPLEQLLNTATVFRLIELSDLNAPVLKRLLTVAPGTYSHSVMVANLAESACQDIGANGLLARVGAYYHDIGKMDQSDYFIENQAAYNKHVELAPRLSATVIRSHVKIGVEKARRMALPREVIDIIREHHGNSVITWFYNEALKRESQVNIEDFTYPGNPPRSRESAVVMLADIVEAAVRTLKKPTVTRLEKFIQELFMSKLENDQLSQSDLSFHDLEIIKMAFIRVLAGHYHSRIEYPKLNREASPGAPPGGVVSRGRAGTGARSDEQG
ncbi:MAG: HDIG domain-containing protein [Spirochaetaceae bacterium]|jgi:putative nucleotidyltransferase with HDIG domain|nr:HDIG domain-containing protein [Spirochaetaceae bacterium]